MQTLPRESHAEGTQTGGPCLSVRAPRAEASGSHPRGPQHGSAFALFKGPDSGSAYGGPSVPRLIPSSPAVVSGLEDGPLFSLVTQR